MEKYFKLKCDRCQILDPVNLKETTLFYLIHLDSGLKYDDTIYIHLPALHKSSSLIGIATILYFSFTSSVT